jgi:hypothetical protein
MHVKLAQIRPYCKNSLDILLQVTVVTETLQEENHYLFSEVKSIGGTELQLINLSVSE